MEVEGYERRAVEKKKKVIVELEDEDEEIDHDARWSEPIALKCCCVCHNMGRDGDRCLDYSVMWV